MPMEPDEYLKMQQGKDFKKGSMLPMAKREVYCKVCLADQRKCGHSRRELEEQYIAKNFSAKKVAGIVGTTPELVKAHFTGHYRSDRDAALARIGNAENEALDTFKEYTYVKVITEKVFDKAMNLLEQDDPNPRDIKALVSEVRLLAKTVAEIDGRIKPASKVQVNQVIHNYNDLKEAIFKDLCYDCRIKVMRGMSGDDIIEVVPEVVS